MKWFIDIWNKPVDEYDAYYYIAKDSQTDLLAQKSNADYMIGWSRFNPNHTKLFVLVYVPLLLVQLVKDRMQASQQPKKALHNLFLLLHPLMSLVLICIASKIAMDLMQASI